MLEGTRRASVYIRHLCAGAEEGGESKEKLFFSPEPRSPRELTHVTSGARITKKVIDSVLRNSLWELPVFFRTFLIV